MIASRRSWRVAQRRRLRTFFCSRLKNDSIAALSAQVPTRPIDPRRPWVRSASRKAWDRNSALAAAIGMHDCAHGRVPAQHGGVAKSVDGQLGGHPGVHRVADDLVAASVLDRAEVELALTGGVLGDAGQPQLVEPVGVELPGDQVVVDRWPRPAVVASFLRMAE